MTAIRKYKFRLHSRGGRVGRKRRAVMDRRAAPTRTKRNRRRVKRARRNPLSGKTANYTVKTAIKALQQHGVVLKTTEYGEYRVNFKGGSEDTAYYTDDLDDAVATGLHMAKATHASRNPQHSARNRLREPPQKFGGDLRKPRQYLIEAMVVSYTKKRGRNRVKYYYFNGSGLDDHKSNAVVFKALHQAEHQARKLLPLMPKQVASVRVVRA